MTTSEYLIVLATLTITVSVVVSGIAMILEGYRVWRAGKVAWWPVSALIAIGGVFLGVGLVLAQGTAWRIDATPGTFTSANGPLSVLVRCITAVICVALARRILQKSLLTDGDRKRVNGHGRPQPPHEI